jgi:hypothetical protein
MTYLLLHALQAAPQLHQRHVDVVRLLLLRRGGLRAAPTIETYLVVSKARRLLAHRSMYPLSAPARSTSWKATD